MGYLGGIPKSSEWIKQREQDWKSYNAITLVDSDISRKEKAALKTYFFEGDVDALINEYKVTFFEILYYSPVYDIGDLQVVIAKAAKQTEFLFQDPEWMERCRGLINRGLNMHIMDSLFGCLSQPYEFDWGEDRALAVFKWVFGEHYDPNRDIELKHDNYSRILPIKFDTSVMAMRLRSGLKDYLWRPKETVDSKRYAAVVDYFLSLYPHINSFCFSRWLPDEYRFDFEGKTYITGELVGNRAFIANLHGILTEYEKEEEIDSLVCFDERLLNKIKTTLSSGIMPKEYYELEKFVLKHGEDCLFASE